MNINTIKFAVIGCLIIACGVFFGLWRYSSLELETARTSLKTANMTISHYENNNTITEEVGNEYQNSLNTLDADARRLRNVPVRCYPVAGTTGGIDASAAKDKLSEGIGIRSEWIYDFAGRCEAERLKVIGLQNFINRIYDARAGE